jgi:hypothetical protein
VIQCLNKNDDHSKDLLCFDEEREFQIQLRYVGSLDVEFRPVFMKVLFGMQRHKDNHSKESGDRSEEDIKLEEDAKDISNESKKLVGEDVEEMLPICIKIEDFLIRENFGINDSKNISNIDKILDDVAQGNFAAKMDVFKGYEYLIKEDCVKHLHGMKEVLLQRVFRAPSEDLAYLLILVTDQSEVYFALLEILKPKGKYFNRESKERLINYLKSLKIQLLY